ncbi:hypothetical protein [Salimicrobium halophilum]|uniref:Uncharacterized protein n=1 Tax=Salimicrobium halophilum TaxID=86666 RepID=A0A1G8VL93_9BACI|nr:hypothetical protein [Salimicrobium halophilum]SDJ66846.1 hypothetical protein SAMN04490247_2784 [Salimicrobium halophilum]
MEMIRWSFDRRKVVRAYFDKFPDSTFYFRRIRSYYFLYSSDWSHGDPVLDKEDQEKMQVLVNEALGRKNAYKNRKSRYTEESYH